MKTIQLYVLLMFLVAYATARSVKFGLVAFVTKAKVKINNVDYLEPVMIGFSGFFLLFSIIFAIFFKKYQQKRKKKASK